jgi:NADH-quinone oxidoreductase subunit I
MWNYLKTVSRGFHSLCAGLWITLRFLFKKPVTVQYPYESIPMKPRYRGHIQLTLDAATGRPKCVACMACEKACPSGCIKVAGEKPAGAARRTVTAYTLNFTACSLCGLCVESCNFGALEFSKEYNRVSFKKEDFLMDLMKRAEGGNRA